MARCEECNKRATHRADTGAGGVRHACHRCLVRLYVTEYDPATFGADDLVDPHDWVPFPVGDRKPCRHGIGWMVDRYCFPRLVSPGGARIAARRAARESGLTNPEAFVVDRDGYYSVSVGAVV